MHGCHLHIRRGLHLVPLHPNFLPHHYLLLHPHTHLQFLEVMVLSGLAVTHIKFASRWETYQCVMVAEITFPSLTRLLFSMQNSVSLLVLVLDFQHLSSEMLTIMQAGDALSWGGEQALILVTSLFLIVSSKSLRPCRKTLFQQSSWLHFELWQRKPIIHHNSIIIYYYHY